jgi:hypothetical protein
LWQEVDKLEQISEDLYDLEYLLSSPMAGYEEKKEAIEAFLKKFDEKYVVTPPATATGAIKVAKEGKLYSPRWYLPKGICSGDTGHPQAKFAEVMLGYNHSFDFEAGEDATIFPKRCDTPIWVSWRGDELFVVNYFYDDSLEKVEPEYDTKEPCQFEGTWENDVEATHKTVGHFYGSFGFDTRKEIRVSSSSHTKIDASIVGYQDSFSFCAFFTTCATVKRSVYAVERTQTTSSGSEWYRDSLAFPFNDRSIFYTAAVKSTAGKTTSTSFGKKKFIGNTGFVRWGHVYEFICHWHGHCCPGFHIGWEAWGKTKVAHENPCIMGELVPMDEPGPNVCESLVALGPPGFPHYQPCDSDPNCSGYPGVHDCGPLICALNGVFYSSFNDVDYSSSSTKADNKVEWEVKIYGDTHINGHAIIKGQQTGDEVESPLSRWWWNTSPDNCENFCKVSVGVNRWGSSIINYHDELDAMNTYNDGKPESMHSDPSATFVGFVSENVN